MISGTKPPPPPVTTFCQLYACEAAGAALAALNRPKLTGIMVSAIIARYIPKSIHLRRLLT